jgi:hypothetical protein
MTRRVSRSPENGLQRLGSVGSQRQRTFSAVSDATSTGATDGNAYRGSVWRRSPALAGIIGALRAWTVAMISALSIPCR